MTDRGGVLVCESLCRGFEHAAFNAALVHAVALAFPDAPLTFVGAADHIAHVRDRLASAAALPAGRVDWCATATPPRDLFGWRRLAREVRWVGEVLATPAAAGARAIVFSAVTPTLLLALRLALRRRVPVLVVFHSLLAVLQRRKPVRPWHWVLALQHVLRLPGRPGVVYAVLGEPIYRQLLAIHPIRPSDWAFFDSPYHWQQRAATAPPDAAARGVRFGYFGVSSKGFDAFHRLARAVGRESDGVRFTLVGFLDSPEHRVRDWPGVDGLGAAPLDAEEFARRAAALTYAVWTVDPRHYRLVASGSFLDAVSFAKPGIYLRNPFIEHYFREMGDIGYLCDTVEEMEEVMRSIVRQFPAARYQAQVANLLRHRSIFEPATVARTLRRILSAAATQIDRAAAEARG